MSKTAQGQVSQLRRLDSLTPAGEAACERLETAIHEAITEAEDSGLCFGMILGVLAQSQWWMHQRCDQESE